MNFSVLPPEINSGRMVRGQSMLAAAAAYGWAAELGWRRMFGLVTSGPAVVGSCGGVRRRRRWRWRRRRMRWLARRGLGLRFS